MAVIKKKATTKRRGNWKPGQSGNPKGAPKRGQSWAEIIKEIGELTPDEARAMSQKIFAQIQLGNEITLKQAVVLRVYASMLFEPQPGLINAFMDRADGKVSQPIETWQDRVIALLKDQKVTPEQVEDEFGADVATDLIIAAGLSLGASGEVGATGGPQPDADRLA